MRTTVTLDDHLLEEAQRLTGLTQRKDLIQEGLKALIARESAVVSHVWGEASRIPAPNPPMFPSRVRIPHAQPNGSIC